MITPQVAYSGWLRKDDGLPWAIHSIPIDPATRTRREEYWWVRQRIAEDTWTVLDAATGYVLGWHVLPEILIADGFHVTACDMNPLTLDMPGARFLKREVANLLALPYADNAFDTVLCVSTLEHLTVNEMRHATSELLRVAKHQLLITADEANWLPTMFGFAGGSERPPEPRLSPPVYALDLRAE